MLAAQVSSVHVLLEYRFPEKGGGILVLPLSFCLYVCPKRVVCKSKSITPTVIKLYRHVDN